MNILLILVIVAGLIVFGCTGGSTGEKKTDADKTKDTTTTSNTDNEANVENSSVDSDNNVQNAADNVVDKLLGKGYADLVALGVPLECDVKTKDYDNKEVYIKLYMKGKNFKSTGTGSLSGSTCTGFTTILSDKIIYMGCETGELLQSCKWIKMDTTKLDNSTSNSLASSATTSDSLDKIPKTDITCKPGLFGDEAFMVTGDVCDLSEMFKNFGSSDTGYGSSDDYQYPPNPE